MWNISAFCTIFALQKSGSKVNFAQNPLFRSVIELQADVEELLTGSFGLKRFFTGIGFYDVHISVALHTCSGRYQLTDDDVLLKTEQMVDLTLDSCLGKHLGGLLEGGG